MQGADAWEGQRDRLPCGWDGGRAPLPHRSACRCSKEHARHDASAGGEEEEERREEEGGAPEA